MEFLNYIFYGIIQGLTEFIPVSSTAHLKSYLYSLELMILVPLFLQLYKLEVFLQYFGILEKVFLISKIQTLENQDIHFCLIN